jgi:hypothetical protein
MQHVILFTKSISRRKKILRLLISELKAKNKLQHVKLFFSKELYPCVVRETERQRDRETERQRDRETERQRDRETERQRDRELSNRINMMCLFFNHSKLSRLYARSEIKQLLKLL